jgi:hypothetical protein
MPTVLFATALALLALAAPASAWAVEPRGGQDQAVWSAGYALWGIADEAPLHGAFAEWRGPPFWRGFSPWIGGGLAEGGAVHLGGGLAWSIDAAPGWRVSVLSGPSWFHEGRILRLGSEFEWFTSLEVAWRIGGGRRLALAAGHVSNAGASRINPGSEFLRVGLHVPVGPR